MKNETVNTAPSEGSLSKRVLDWFDVRTGIRGIASTALDEPVPGGARWAYVFGSGLLFILVLQIITGVALALYYTPTAETAHTSVAYITKQVAGGSFLRSLHSYGSSAMIIVLLLHFLQTTIYGAYKGRRELLWISGAFLSLLDPWDGLHRLPPPLGSESLFCDRRGDQCGGGDTVYRKLADSRSSRG